MRFFSFLLLFIFNIYFSAMAQDTLLFKEIRITTSIVKQTLFRTPEAAAVIDSTKLSLQTIVSLLPAFNAIPGVKMEERSPGSYRLSIRGSLLRSPFGVRNVKVYMNDYPLTDAGGNTYINVLSLNAVKKIDILKGPDGSLFGANSGGVITFHSTPGSNKIETGISGGSYGLLNQYMQLGVEKAKHSFRITESYQRSDGYRENSQLHRFYLQADEHWRYAENRSIKALVFYSNLYYQTPGGLTKLQYDNDPSKSRLATATLPGAKEQKAAVYNKMLFTGITHETKINSQLEHVIALFASQVNFKNPFITNFETRKENTAGVRTYFSFFSKQPVAKRLKWEYNIGLEWQQTGSDIANFENNKGEKAGLLAAGNILTDQHFFFNKLKIDLNKKLLFEAGLSINYYRYRFSDSVVLKNRFKPQLMPRLAMSYFPVKNIALRSTVSRGYSAPTTAEIRPSDNNLYTGLQPETGLNLEAGIRYALKNKLWIELSAFTYKLKNAIVRQQNLSGSEYFINAGGTKQNGIEGQVNFTVFSSKKHTSFLHKIQLTSSGTFNQFTFKNYIVSNADYSGNKITGVPKRSVVSNLLLRFKYDWYFFLQHQYSSAIPLNDANDVFAASYNLFQLKLGYPVKIKNAQLSFFAGIDNITNEKYSLGNDLNAAGKRYYNAAPTRNCFLGITYSGK